MASLIKRVDRPGHWQIGWRDESGKQRSNGLGKMSKKDRDVALAEANLVARGAKNGLVIKGSMMTASSKKGPLFNEYAKEYQEQHAIDYPRSEQTCTIRMRVLIPHFGSLRVEDSDEAISAWDKAWKEYKKKRIVGDGVSPNTLDGEWNTLNRSLNTAIPGIIKRNPLSDTEFGPKLNKPLIHCFSPVELKNIERADNQYGAAWRFLVNTGLRRGEAIALRRNLVGSDEVAILNDPDAGIETKTNLSRIIPLSDDAKDARDQILWENKESDRFFDPATPTSWSRRFRKARIRGGVEKGTLHSLRHCFISHLVNDLREPITVAAELAGHSKIETTMKYIHVLPDHAKRAMARFSLYEN